MVLLWTSWTGRTQSAPPRLYNSAAGIFRASVRPGCISLSFFLNGEKEKKLPRSPFLSPEKESYVIIPGPVMFSSSRRDPAHRTDPSPISFFFPTPHEQGVVIAELAREEGRERGGVRRGLVALSLCALHEQVLFAPPVRSRIRSHDVVQ